MIKTKHYIGKITLSYETHREQIAINRLFELLETFTIEEMVIMLNEKYSKDRLATSFNQIKESED